MTNLIRLTPTDPCRHFKFGLTNKTQSECPYCEVDSLRNTTQALSAANESWSTKANSLKELLSEALYAIEYGLDITKPDDMSGCDCPMCVMSRKIRKVLK